MICWLEVKKQNGDKSYLIPIYVNWRISKNKQEKISKPFNS